MENKTPMQEIIEDLKKNNPHHYADNKTWYDKLLEKERQVVESCCIDMVNLSITKIENKDFVKGMEEEFNNYYNQKFRKDE